MKEKTIQFFENLKSPEMLSVDNIFSEQIVGVCHCLELKVVSCWVLKEHCPLFARLSLKA